jgi:hypothetical protein
MASEPYDPRVMREANGGGIHAPPEPSLGELLRRLSHDSGELVRQEMLLAKAEVRRTGATLARDGARIGVAVGFALAGTLALGAFAVLALGQLLGNYWLAALIVGVVLLAAGFFLGTAAVNDVKRRSIGVPQTADTLREDAAWAKQELRAVRRELTTHPRGD